ncbi:hypothetical protein ACVIKP_007378 [Rhizobium leguminosarum]
MDLFWKEHVPISEVAALHETHPNTILDTYVELGSTPSMTTAGT